MPGQRTFDDDEVREIFAAAALRDAETRLAPATNGLTLAELQDIGREVGLDPVQVARAAAALDTPMVAVRPRTSLGMPVEVTRIVPLKRAPTSEEWERLVAELRTTFRARGKVSSDGGLREWANGNLHACIEPSATGYHLRLGTLKTTARTLNALGAASLATGAVAAGSLLVTGGVAEALFVPFVVTAYGVAAFATNLVRLPRWADERRRQMDYIAAKFTSIMEGER